MKTGHISHRDDGGFKAHSNRHRDPLGIYQAFPEGRQFRIWLPKISYPIYIEITANTGVGYDSTSQRDYTFVECKTIIPKQTGLSAALYEPGKIGYIVALNEDSPRSHKFQFTDSLSDGKKGLGGQEISMITALEDPKSKGHATQVTEILAGGTTLQ